MKHVIVIETADVEYGGREIYPVLARYLESRLEKALLNIEASECVIRSRFNVKSAIAAVHEMYGAEKWEG